MEQETDGKRRSGGMETALEVMGVLLGIGALIGAMASDASASFAFAMVMVGVVWWLLLWGLSTVIAELRAIEFNTRRK